MGPSKTKVWNSPFSPQGSACGGRSQKKDSSNSRPAKLESRTLLSTQTTTARNRWGEKERTTCGVHASRWERRQSCRCARGWFRDRRGGLRGKCRRKRLCVRPDRNACAELLPCALRKWG